MAEKASSERRARADELDGGEGAPFSQGSLLWRPRRHIYTHVYPDPWVDDICPTPPHAPQLSTQVMMLPEYPCDATAAAPTT